MNKSPIARITLTKDNREMVGRGYWRCPILELPGTNLKEVRITGSTWNITDHYEWHSKGKRDEIGWKGTGGIPEHDIFVEVEFTKVLVRRDLVVLLSSILIPLLTMVGGSLGAEIYKRGSGHKDYDKQEKPITVQPTPKSVATPNSIEPSKIDKVDLAYKLHCGGKLTSKPYYRVYSISPLDDVKMYCGDANPSIEDSKIALIATFDDEVKAKEFSEKISKHLVGRVWMGGPENK